MEKKIFLTHYFNTELPKEGFKPTSFLTSDLENITKGIYFQGLDGIRKVTQDMFKNQVNNSGIINLEGLYVIRKDESVWLDKNGFAYIGKEKEAVQGNLRKISGSQARRSYSMFIKKYMPIVWNQSVTLPKN